MKAIILSTFLFIAPTLWGQTILSVPTGAFPTIQAAINVASSGDTINVAPGTYAENITLALKSLTLQGAGQGQTIIDGSNLASVIEISQTPMPGLIIDGFTIQNGLGSSLQLSPASSPFSVGGGVRILGSDPSFPGSGAWVTLRNCEIRNNVASSGAGVWGFSSVILTVEDCLVSTNSTIGTVQPPMQKTAGIHIQQNSSLVVRRCEMSGNICDNPQEVVGSITAIAASAIVEGCDIGGNSNYGYVSSGSPTIKDSIIHNNTLGGIRGGQSAAPGLIQNCIIHSHLGGTASAALYLAGDTLVEGCTIENNQLVSNLSHFFGGPTLTGGGIVVINGFTSVPVIVEVRNSIVRNNTPVDTIRFPIPPGVLQPPPPFPPNYQTVLTVDNTCYGISQEALVGTGNISVDPMFVDPLAADYRLDPLSPCIDAGDQNSPNIGASDMLGNPRVVFANTDMGAIESTHIGLGSVFDGNIGLGMGGPYNVLRINGTPGDAAHRVNVSIGTSSMMSLDQPPTNGLAANFAIFGIWGEPSVFDSFALPFNIGDIGFIPCPVIPALEPVTFVFAASIPLGTCTPIYPWGPAPWSSGPGPAIFFPLKITFQGVVEETPGTYKVTNGIVWEMK